MWVLTSATLQSWPRSSARKFLPFEMQRCLMPLIERNININGFTNVHAINAAVGDKRGLAGYSRAQFSALLGIYPGIDPDDYAPMITLDDTMANFENISIIKIDVEGFEGQVLEGGTEHAVALPCTSLFWSVIGRWRSTAGRNQSFSPFWKLLNIASSDMRIIAPMVVPC